MRNTWYKSKSIEIFLFTLICFIFVSLNSCAADKPDETYDIQSIDLGHKIYLGMNKSEVDKLLGEPFDGGTLFLYDDTLGINYDYGAISSLITQSNQWETDKKIKVGSTVDEISKAYGEPADQNNKSTITYFLNQNNDQCKIPDAVKYVAFSIDERSGEVETILVSTYSNSSKSSESNQAQPETGTMTTGQKNALEAANNYLKIMPFSYSGLIEQLEYEKYSTEDATFAADNCGADWNEQAAKSAEKYLSIMSFSRDSLIEQLEYDGYTHSQAVYGAKQNGY